MVLIAYNAIFINSIRNVITCFHFWWSWISLMFRLIWMHVKYFDNKNGDIGNLRWQVMSGILATPKITRVITKNEHHEYHSVINSAVIKQNQINLSWRIMAFDHKALAKTTQLNMPFLDLEYHNCAPYYTST